MIHAADVLHAELDAVAGVAAADVWAAGAVMDHSANYYTSLIEHWDGSAWRKARAAKLGAGTQSWLEGLAVSSPTEVWGVGFQLTDEPLPLVERFDGRSWKVVPTPSKGFDSQLAAVASISPSDVWAVGDWQPTQDEHPHKALIEHWDGSTWSVVPSPSGKTDHALLSAVAGSSADDVWAAGSQQAAIGAPDYPLVEHFDGTRWKVLPSAVLRAGGFITGVVATSPSDAWMVGVHDSGPKAFIEHWDGTSWRVDRRAGLPHESWLSAITARSSSDVWAVGGTGSTPHLSALVERWDGTSWTSVAVPSTRHSSSLAAITTTPQGDAWAVGDYPAFSEHACRL